jgi:ribosome recycling factor
MAPLNESTNPTDIESASKMAMANAMTAFHKQLDRLHTGRASPALLESIHISLPDGGHKMLSHVATITTIDAHTLRVTPWDKSMLQAAQKAILHANLGLNPAPQGEALRVQLPPFSDQRRRDMIKMIDSLTEDMCEEIRNHRRHANNQFKRLLKDKNMSEDEERRSHKKIQQLTDDYIAQIKALASEKERRVMTA